MRKRKTLDQLTLMDDYMFYQVMKDPGRMKRVLEWILNITITKLEYVVSQKTEKEGYDSKAIRLDLYVEDENHIIYNVEVQTSNKKNLPKRSVIVENEDEANLIGNSVLQEINCVALCTVSNDGVIESYDI